MIIHVTQDDIDHGLKNNCRVCPIALAIKRETKALGVNVLHRSIVIIPSGNDPVRRYEHTAESFDFVTKFDAGQTVEPFQFELSC